MDVAQRTALIDAMEKTFAETGIDLYEGSQGLKAWLDPRFFHVAAAQSRQSLDAYLAGLPEEDDESVQQMILLCLAAPKIMKGFVLKAVTQVADSAPTPSGRPARLTIELERKIASKTIGLIRQKVSIGTAQTRCAQEFGISKRTVQSAWSRRDELAQQPFQTVEDLFNFFRS